MSYQNQRQGNPSRGKVEKYYYYHDESGVTLFRVVRKTDKKFHQEKYLGHPERYTDNIKGIRRVLYNLQLVSGASTVWVFEGEKDTNAFREFLTVGEAATTNPMGALKWKSEYSETLKGKRVIIVEDKDEIGQKHAQLIADDLKNKAKSVKIISVPGKGTKDFSDWLDLNLLQVNYDRMDYPQPGLVPIMRSILLDIAEKSTELAVRTLSEALNSIVVSFSDFLELKLPTREMLLEPWLEEASYGLLYGKQGSGKTWMAMEIAAALANERDAMGGLWTVKKSVPVLYVDGEMHWQDIWERGKKVGLDQGHILSKTYLESQGQPYDLNLADEVVRFELGKFILSRGYKVVVLDNIFSLVYGIDTNSDRDWSPINQWCLRLRANGVSMILIHHTGKSAAAGQLGTSSRMFNLNWALALISPKTESGEEPCCFRITIDKKRGLMPGLTGRQFICKDGVWSVGEMEEIRAEEEKDKLMEICAMLVEDGMAQKDIAEVKGISGAAVNQNITKAINSDLIRKVKRGKFEWTVEGHKRFETIKENKLSHSELS